MCRLVAFCVLMIAVSPGMAQPKAGKPLADDLALAPADSMMIMHIKVKDLWDHDSLSEVRTIYSKAGVDAISAFDKRFGSIVKNVDRLTFCLEKLAIGNSSDDNRMFAILKFAAPLDQKQFTAHFGDKPVPKKGRFADYFVTSDGEVGVRFVSPTLVVFGSLNSIQSMCDAPSVKQEGPLARLIQQANESTKPYLLGVSVNALEPSIKDYYRAAIPKELHPLLAAEAVYASIDLEREGHVQISAVYSDKNAVDQAEKAVADAKALAGVMIAGHRKQLLAIVEGDGKPAKLEQMTEAALGLMGLGVLQHLEDVLKAKAITRESNALSMSVQLPPQFKSVAGALALTHVALPASIWKVQEANLRIKSSNNLKKIGLAMHLYESEKDHFPPAAIFDKKGRALLSWRVAILPYINEEDLYKQFKLDEPWDSEHNIKLAEKVVSVYQTPGVKGLKPGYTNYRLFVGNGAMFDKIRVTRIADVSDGLSNTIMAVEAKESVPWTKPEELEYDPKKEIPKLGDFHRQGFIALYGDGSVRFHAKVPGSIKFRIERADGNVIPDD